MNVQKMMASVLEYLQRLENAMDYDPIEAQGRRLAHLERELEEISGRLQEGAGAGEPECTVAKLATTSRRNALPRIRPRSPRQEPA